MKPCQSNVNGAPLGVLVSVSLRRHSTRFIQTFLLLFAAHYLWSVLWLWCRQMGLFSGQVHDSLVCGVLAFFSLSFSSFFSCMHGPRLHLQLCFGFGRQLAPVSLHGNVTVEVTIATDSPERPVLHVAPITSIGLGVVLLFVCACACVRARGTLEHIGVRL